MRQTEQKLFRGSTAKAIVEVLSLLGVDRVFGLPGIQNTELFDELADAPFDTWPTLMRGLRGDLVL